MMSQDLPVNIEVVNTGTELLLGNTLNTHGAWFGRELFQMGLRISRQTTVPDGDAIRESLAEALTRADAVIVTGGLGPTSDDLTREITAEVLGLDMITDEASLRSLENFFIRIGKPMVDANLKQALCPVGADVLPNLNGTAPGIYVPPRLNGRSHCAVFLLPGPPRELYPMFHSEVVPRLRALAGLESVNEALVLKFTGIGESDFHDGVDEQLAMLPGLEYGYCAHIGELDLRLIGAPEALAMGRDLVLEKFNKFLVSDDGSSMEETVVRLLKERGMTLTTAESCTGGLIASRITNVPGSSEVFTHGFITYGNGAKASMLGVFKSDIEAHGAVSETVACQMALGALRASGSNMAVAVTGIAGPSGGTELKPVGTAWLAVAAQGEEPQASRLFYPRNRRDFKMAVSQAALEAVRRRLIGIR
jgi:nicotinamide-nucleotide amidase